MFRRCARFALVLSACVATAAVPTVSQAQPLTALLPEHGPVVPLKDAAMVKKTKIGYRYMAGQQDSHLVVTQTGNRVRFVDTGTKELRKRPKSCTQESRSNGIAVTCKIPKKYGTNNPMFLEIWPRLGDDFVDGSSLSSTFRMWVLADAGRDVVHTGAGRDFVNGAQGDDKVYAGAGDDWIRTGKNDDQIWGGAGNDKLVGSGGHDTIYGGDGDDRIGGAAGSDRIWGEAGRDRVSCGGGADTAWLDYLDTDNKCEARNRV